MFYCRCAAARERQVDSAVDGVEVMYSVPGSALHRRELPMIPGLRKKVPLRARYLIYNAILLGAFWLSGKFRSDWASIVGVIGALAVMNLVAWISARHYKEWK